MDQDSTRQTVRRCFTTVLVRMRIKTCFITCAGEEVFGSAIKTKENKREEIKQNILSVIHEHFQLHNMSLTKKKKKGSVNLSFHVATG